MKVNLKFVETGGRKSFKAFTEKDVVNPELKNGDVFGTFDSEFYLQHWPDNFVKAGVSNDPEKKDKK